MNCKRCEDTGWVCEQHPTKPMNHDGDTCPGPGEPCPVCRKDRPKK